MTNLKKNIRVLVQIRDLRVGNGIAASIMNYYAFTTQRGVNIDFLVTVDIDSEYRSIVLGQGSRIYVMPHKTSKPDQKNVSFICQILSNGYDVLHVNQSGFYALASLKEAEKLGIKVRIYHAHNPKEPTSVKVFLRNALYVNPGIKHANFLAACSQTAGASIYNNRCFQIIPNAINTQRYLYDQFARKRIRDELGITEKIVIGTVCRIEDQKNPFAIFNIFLEIKKIHLKAVLLWVGEGSRRKEIERKIKQNDISESVIMLGARNDVNKLYSAMDVFLLPSKYEGLGIVFIEAQASGLECYASDAVPKDVEITTAMHRKPLSEDPKKWAESIKCEEISTEERIIRGKIVSNSYFEINNSKHCLFDYYDKCLHCDSK